MKKTVVSYVCQSCHYRVSKWHGRCPECEAWNSFEEEEQFSRLKHKGSTDRLATKLAPIAITAVKQIRLNRVATNITEFDRVIGGGLVEGGVMLFAGEPGVGKSTLLASILNELIKLNKTEKALYVSGEESLEQVAQRMKRVGTVSDQIFVYCERNWQEIKKQVIKIKPRVMIVDSIQTISSNQIDSPAGTISQIKEVTDEIIMLTKESRLSTLIVGHITKEGGIAGPKTLEHMVDTVLYFENSQNNDYRMIRATKNRFGPTTEIGIFEMNDNGIQEVGNVESVFIEKLKDEENGRIISTVIEGSRVLLVEAQALVNENKYGHGKRLTQGVDVNRVQMLIAIIEKFLAKKLSDSDIYINMVGIDVKSGKNCDLAIVTSILASIEKMILKHDVVFIGEVGLSGEIRPVRRDHIIVNELIKLNVKNIIASSKTAEKVNSEGVCRLIGIDHISQIKNLLEELK
jgi:DNA repair protein RadA/Sms